VNNALTDVQGILVGHWSDPLHGTGCTVVLTPEGSCCGVDVRGSAPGTRETALLDPVNRVDRVHGVLLSGGSAYGLGAAHGVVKWLADKGFGWYTPAASVPIVPAAILYDLGLGGSTIYPTQEDAFAACEAATSEDTSRGSVGAGIGCTVGKLFGFDRCTRGGLGQASATLPGGVVISALVAVNAVGDVVDPMRAHQVAGVRDSKSGELVDSLAEAAASEDWVFFRSSDPNSSSSSDSSDESASQSSGPVPDNTTIGVVATNLSLSKPAVTKLAQMGQTGVSRTTRPAHTLYDGDCLFALATGRLDVQIDLNLVGAVAAEVVASAVLDGVLNATPAYGVPAASELTPRRLIT